MINTAKIITALFYAETAFAHAFKLRRWDSERHAAKLLVFRLRNLRAALHTATEEMKADRTENLLAA